MVQGGDEDEEADVELLSQYEDEAALATPEKDAVSPRSMMGIYRYAINSLIAM